MRGTFETTLGQHRNSKQMGLGVATRDRPPPPPANPTEFCKQHRNSGRSFIVAFPSQEFESGGLFRFQPLAIFRD